MSGNAGVGVGRTGDVQGGGIWNGMFPVPFLEGLHSNLRLDKVVVTGNRVVGGQPTGGGIYTRDPIEFSGGEVRGNGPNDCTGCTAAPAGSATTVDAVARRDGSGQRSFTDPLVARLIQLTLLTSDQKVLQYGDPAQSV